MKPSDVFEALAEPGDRPRLAAAAETVAASEALDDRAALLDSASAALGQGPHIDALRGNWLGHPAHPVAVDLPLGCWTAASILDVIGGRGARPAAQRLVGVGVLAALPAAASGLVEWRSLEDPATRRVATAHALANTAAVGLYAMSWRARRRRHHFRGVLAGLAGGVVAAGSGYLGGYLAFALGAGRDLGGDGGGDGPIVTWDEELAAGAVGER